MLLAPAALIYAAASALHRRLWLRPAPTRPALPLVVIGALRAGGAGKTAVTLELARRLTAQGKRVGILAYRIRGSAKTDPAEIRADADWRDSSDEAVLLARESGARVFATRHRARAWRLLHSTGAFDVLLSDDGLMDTRLRGAWRVALVGPGERPRTFDLLPAGPYRLTASALRKADFVLKGPLTPETPDETGFRREPVLPPGFDAEKTYWILSGLGNPGTFRRSLEAAGVKVGGMSVGPDHGLPDLEKARRALRKAALTGATAGFLYAAKDAIKLETLLEPHENAGRIGERVTFPAAFLSALDAFLASPSS